MYRIDSQHKNKLGISERMMLATQKHRELIKLVSQTTSNISSTQALIQNSLNTSRKLRNHLRASRKSGVETRGMEMELT